MSIAVTFSLISPKLTYLDLAEGLPRRQGTLLGEAEEPGRTEEPVQLSFKHVTPSQGGGTRPLTVQTYRRPWLRARHRGGDRWTGQKGPHGRPHTGLFYQRASAGHWREVGPFHKRSWSSQPSRGAPLP